MTQRSLFVESGADASGLVAAAVIPSETAINSGVLEPLAAEYTSSQSLRVEFRGVKDLAD